MPISCGPESQKAFNHAVWTLHSFWYPEALKAFTDITRAELGCAMGYWGIAMSNWSPRFVERQQMLNEGIDMARGGKKKKKMYRRLVDVVGRCELSRPLIVVCVALLVNGSTGRWCGTIVVGCDVVRWLYWV